MPGLLTRSGGGSGITGEIVFYINGGTLDLSQNSATLIVGTNGDGGTVTTGGGNLVIKLDADDSLTQAEFNISGASIDLHILQLSQSLVNLITPVVFLKSWDGLASGQSWYLNIHASMSEAQVDTFINKFADIITAAGLNYSTTLVGCTVIINPTSAPPSGASAAAITLIALTGCSLITP